MERWAMPWQNKHWPPIEQPRDCKPVAKEEHRIAPASITQPEVYIACGAGVKFPPGRRNTLAVAPGAEGPWKLSKHARAVFLVHWERGSMR